MYAAPTMAIRTRISGDKRQVLWRGGIAKRPSTLGKWRIAVGSSVVQLPIFAEPNSLSGGSWARGLIAIRFHAVHFGQGRQVPSYSREVGAIRIEASI
jgi:hypothetical protein